jgi:predicted Ser/Thr protein kinase
MTNPAWPLLLIAAFLVLFGVYRPRAGARSPGGRPSGRARWVTIGIGLPVLAAVAYPMLSPFADLSPVDIRRPTRDYFLPILLMMLYVLLVVVFILAAWLGWRSPVSGPDGRPTVRSVAVLGLAALAFAAAMTGVAVTLGAIPLTTDRGLVRTLLLGAAVASGAAAAGLFFRDPAWRTRDLPADPASDWPCPGCGRPVGPGAPEGLCPSCLLRAALPAADGLSPTAAFVEGADAPPVEDVARRLPHLEVRELIGQGGMGAVYLARQPALDRPVALKLVRPRAADPAFAERFAREARALARLSHPNVVAVYESGEADGLPYLVMEYVPGATLRALMRDRRQTPAAALALVPQLCDALDYAHAQGVVHRDVKPENILVTPDGRVKVVDFGLAKVADPAAGSLTGTRQAMGTPHYMAPEQWERPGTVDHRADIYALGVVLYELLTGELPHGRFDPPSRKAGVDARVDAVVFRALARAPGDRYQRAGEVKADLDGLRPGTD